MKTTHAWLVVWGNGKGQGSFGYDTVTDEHPPNIRAATEQARKAWLRDFGRGLPVMTQSIRCESADELQASVDSLPI